MDAPWEIGGRISSDPFHRARKCRHQTDYSINTFSIKARVNDVNETGTDFDLIAT